MENFFSVLLRTFWPHFDTGWAASHLHTGASLLHHWACLLLQVEQDKVFYNLIYIIYCHLRLICNILIILWTKYSHIYLNHKRFFSARYSSQSRDLLWWGWRGLSEMFSNKCICQIYCYFAKVFIDPSVSSWSVKE